MVTLSAIELAFLKELKNALDLEQLKREQAMYRAKLKNLRLLREHDDRQIRALFLARTRAEADE